MKKIVPDPPEIAVNPFFLISPDLPTRHALTTASDFAHGIEQTLDDYCCAHAGEPDIAMLINAAHSARMLRALLTHAAKNT